jgi:3-hydroxyisobutyrate dehydrogenase
MSKVAFVGVGRMGANMARHLQLDCGHDVTAVFDVNKMASAEIAAELGAKDCGSLLEVTEAAEIIFTVVTNDDAMRAIFLHDGDNLFSEASGKTFINWEFTKKFTKQERKSELTSLRGRWHRRFLKPGKGNCSS